MRIRWSGLRTQIIAWTFVPTAIILVAVAWVTFHAYQQVTQDLVMERNQELARLSASQLSGGLAEYSELLASLARTTDFALASPALLDNALRRAANRLAVFDGGVVVLDHTGTVVTSQPFRFDIQGEDWSHRDFFRQIVRTPGPTFSDVLGDGPDGSQVVIVAVPLMGVEGQLLGVLGGMFRLDASSVSSFYGGIVRLRIGRSSTYLVDSNGRIIYHTDSTRIGENVSDESVVQQVISGRVGNSRTTDLSGRAILAGFAPVPGTPWGLVTEESWSSLMDSGRNYREFLLLLLGLGIIMPVVFVMIGMRRITRPIEELSAAAEEVASGKFDQRIVVSTGDELQELAGQFNRMSARLQESYALLEQRVADRTRELATLNAISAVVNSSLDLDEILEDALDKILEATSLASGEAFQLQEEGNPPERHLVLQASRGLPETIAHMTARLPYEGSLAQRAASIGHTFIMDVREDYPDGLLKRALAEAGWQVVISVPLTAKGRLVGSIGLASDRSRVFSQEELSLLDAIGQQIGVALENARLYEKAEEVAAAAERSRLARDLHDAVTQTLFSASLIAEVLPRLWDREPGRGQAAFGRAAAADQGCPGRDAHPAAGAAPVGLDRDPLGRPDAPACRVYHGPRTRACNRYGREPASTAA